MRETAIIDVEALNLLLAKQFGLGAIAGIVLSVLLAKHFEKKMKEKAEEETED